MYWKINKHRNMKKKILLAIATAVGLWVSCTESADKGSKWLSVERTSYEAVNPEGEVISIPVQCRDKWTATANSTWCLPYNTQGSNGDMLILQATANITGEERTATVTLSAEGEQVTIELRQSTVTTASAEEYHYTLPVVFHVLYENSANPLEYAAPSRLYTILEAVNRLYADRNDDVQEYYIRRLRCWGRIRDNYLQKDRNVEYVYSYQIKSFTTDEELLDMYGKRPDAFSEDELLRVSTLKETDAEKKEVYRTILHYFPQSHVAANNLAVLLLREGKEEEAREVFESVEGYSEATLKTKAALYVYNNEYEKAVELLETDIEDPEARYNLGLVKAQMRQLDEVYELLAPFGDVNSAVAALSVNKNEEADRIMKGVASKSPQCEYVRAIAAARLSRGGDAVEHIVNAASDAGLRERAKIEYDFKPYRDYMDFRAAVYKQ